MVTPPTLRPKCLPLLSTHLSMQAGQIVADNWIDLCLPSRPAVVFCFAGIIADRNFRFTMTSSRPTTKSVGYQTPCPSTTWCRWGRRAGQTYVALPWKDVESSHLSLCLLFSHSYVQIAEWRRNIVMRCFMIWGSHWSRNVVTLLSGLWSAVSPLLRLFRHAVFCQCLPTDSVVVVLPTYGQIHLKTQLFLPSTLNGCFSQPKTVLFFLTLQSREIWTHQPHVGVWTREDAEICLLSLVLCVRNVRIAQYECCQ